MRLQYLNYIEYKFDGPLAQLVEQFPFKEWVAGSNPAGLTIKMKKAKIKNIASGIEKNCDILKKNDNILEVVLEGTTIKILLKKKTNKYIGYFKEMEFESDG